MNAPEPLWFDIVLTILLWEALRRMVVTLWIKPFKANRAARKAHFDKPAKPGEQAGECYGHPLPPVKVLYDALPSPPSGHAFEITVTPIELYKREDGVETPVGSLKLVCRLINLVAPLDKRVVSMESVDLIYTAWYSTIPSPTWVAYWREVPDKSDRHKMMKRNLLRPILDWAQAQTDAITVADITGGGEYMMKGS